MHMVTGGNAYFPVDYPKFLTWWVVNTCVHVCISMYMCVCVGVHVCVCNTVLTRMGYMYISIPQSHV